MAKKEVKKAVKKEVKVEKTEDIHNLGVKSNKVMGIEKTPTADTGRCKE